MWITSSKVLPVIMLVVIPISVTIIALLINGIAPIVVSNVAGFPYWFSYIYLISISGLVYAFYPIKFGNIERRGFTNLLIEHTWIKKILYFEVPILIAIISFFSLTSLVYYYDYDNYFSKQLTYIIYTIGDPIGQYNIIICCFEKPPLREVSFSGGNILQITLNGLMINLGIFSYCRHHLDDISVGKKRFRVLLSKNTISNSQSRKGGIKEMGVSR